MAGAREFERLRPGVVTDPVAAGVGELLPEQLVRPRRGGSTVPFTRAEQHGQVDRPGRVAMHLGGEQVRQPGRQADAEQHRHLRVEPLQLGNVAGGGRDVDERGALSRCELHQLGPLQSPAARSCSTISAPTAP